MPDDLPFVPDAILDLVDARWWLELRCACGRTTHMPQKLMAERHGPRAWVPHLVARFRCSTCRQPPIAAEWIDNPAGGAHGSGCPPPRRVPLRLPPGGRGIA